jgi:hypothetical protein
MAELGFELTIRGELTDDRLNALFEAGCDDATLSTKDSVTFAAFDRETPSLLDAVLSAIEAVESVEGFEVVHVDPDELVWASEIASRTGRSRQSVDQLVKGQRGPGGFPLRRLMPPATRSGVGPMSRRGSPSTRAAGPRSKGRSWSAPSTGHCRRATRCERPRSPSGYD